jgi:hypothetical protein
MHSLYEPLLLLRIINKKKHQLAEIEGDLERLPLDHPTRLRWLERMLHLQQGIPALEAEYARRTNEQVAKDKAPVPPSVTPIVVPGQDAATIDAPPTPTETPRTGQEARWSEHDLEMANRKMSDPAKYPLMTAKEVMAYLQISKSTVYEHPGLERAPTGTKAARFTTKSVIAVKNSAPE